MPDLFIDEHSDEEQHDHKNLTDVDDDNEDFACSSTPVLFYQQILRDLIRGLSLSKKSSEVLASQLKDRNLLQHDTKIIFYRTRDKELVPFFDDQLNFVFCKDISGILMKLGVTEYSPDWRLFIDSSKRSQNCVLLHITNVYGSTLIGHSTTLKEKYDARKSVLQHIKCCIYHQWVICVDIKMVNFLLGQQSGYTRYPCFLCY